MFYPMFAMVALTFVVAGYLLFSRIKSAKAGQVDPRLFKLNQSKDIPDKLVQISNNFSNLFEVPLLFYIASLVCIITQLQGWLMITLAWIFVASRIVHSWIHLTRNKIIPRMFAFLTGVLCVFIMWLILLIQMM